MKRYCSLSAGIILLLFVIVFTETTGTGKTITDPAYEVEFRELTFVDSARGRTLKTAFWIPVRGTHNRSGKPYPLIIFSHGHRSINTQSYSLMNEWARHGFIVAAPNHEKNTIRDFDESFQGMMQFARPIDVRFVTDQILTLNKDTKSFLYKMIDPESIGISGHSFGGHTTLITASATPDLDYLSDFCDVRYNDWDICPVQEELQKMYPGKRIINESDPRMKAALALAPDGYGWFRKRGMEKIRIPIMIMGGEMDTVCPVETEQKPMYEGIKTSKYLIVQKRADHLSFSDSCGDSAVKKQIERITTLFWMIHLRKDRKAAESLSQYVSSQQGITTQTHESE